MPIILLESVVTIKLTVAEAQSLRNCLGSMSNHLWKSAGVGFDDQVVAENLFGELEAHLRERHMEGTNK